MGFRKFERSELISKEVFCQKKTLFHKHNVISQKRIRGSMPSISMLHRMKMEKVAAAGSLMNIHIKSFRRFTQNIVKIY